MVSYDLLRKIAEIIRAIQTTSSPVISPKNPVTVKVAAAVIAPKTKMKPPARAPTIPVTAAITRLLKIALSCRSSEMSFTAMITRM